MSSLMDFRIGHISWFLSFGLIFRFFLTLKYFHRDDVQLNQLAKPPGARVGTEYVSLQVSMYVLHCLILLTQSYLPI